LKKHTEFQFQKELLAGFLKKENNQRDDCEVIKTSEFMWLK